MTDPRPKAAGPPKTRKRRPAGTTAAHPENTNISNTKNSTTTATASSRIDTQARMSFLNLLDWSRRTGIAVASLDGADEVLSSDEPVWIIIDWCGGDDPDDDCLALAIKTASYIITAPNLEAVYRFARHLVVSGERVLLIERSAPAPERGDT